MYDTIRFEVETRQFEKVVDKLEKVHERRKFETGEYAYFGYYKNLSVKVFPERVKIENSLAKSYYGNNLETLTREDTEKAIKLIENELDIPISCANVYRIDFGTNLITSRPVHEYFIMLGELPRYKRSEYDNLTGIRYKNSLRELTLYNKFRDLKRNHKAIPEKYCDSNILRYEIRFMTRVARQLNNGEKIKSRQLYDKQFFNEMIKRWESEYFKICRLKRLCFKKLPKNTNVRNFIEQYSLLGMKEAGGEKIILSQINGMREAGDIDKIKHYRLKKRIKALHNSDYLIEQDDNIKELDKKIREVVKLMYCK